MTDQREQAVRSALSRLSSDQIHRILVADTMVCDGVAFDVTTGRY